MPNGAKSAGASLVGKSPWNDARLVRAPRAAAVELRMSLLSAMAPDFKNGHSLDPNFMQGIFHRFQLRGLNDGFDFDHGG